jgi:trehalose/maltose hydrolase-like predicted phosphorylase
MQVAKQADVVLLMFVLGDQFSAALRLLNREQTTVHRSPSIHCPPPPKSAD